MTPLLVLNVVGLSPALLAHAPRIRAVAADGYSRPLTPVLPAVTCSAQSTMLTGLPPADHGVVGNGWYDRERAEVMFWKQSNHIVQGEKVWDTARRRDPACTTANLFWWFNMYGSPDYSVTPRPGYPADGRKVPDCYSHPTDLRDRLQAELGTFPLFRFWGPKADIVSTAWIAESAKRVLTWHKPTISLVYLPHLDYSLQREGPRGPSIPAEVAAIDEVAGDLIDTYRAQGYGVIVLSEYGITPVSDAVFPNRVLRAAGLQTYRVDAAGELLDHGASRAFAVPDHQLAHVYCADPADIPAAREALAATPGIAQVLAGDEIAAIGLDHARSGELVLLSAADRWFAHDWWTRDADMPDYQRTVDIHRKPGYDPRELFLARPEALSLAKLMAKLALRKLGARNLLNVIEQDPKRVRGSHGLLPPTPDEGAVLVSDDADVLPADGGQAAIRDLILARVFGA